MTDASSPPESSNLQVPRRARRAKTRRSVLIADRVADWTIRIGGIFVILAVLGIMAYLIQVVIPLFTGSHVGEQRTVAAAAERGHVLAQMVDDYKTISIALENTGRIGAVHIATGTPLAIDGFDFGGVPVTGFGRTLSGREVAFGFADGSVRFGEIKVVVEILPRGQVPADLKRLSESDATDGKTVYTFIPGDQARRVSVETTLDDPQPISASGRPIIAVDHRTGGTAERPTKAFVTVDADTTAQISRGESELNLLTGELSTNVETTTLPALPPGVVVRDLLITESADQVYVAEKSGRIFRFDTRNFEKPTLAEEADVIAGDAELTTLGFLIGEQSIVVGGSDGSVDIYFRLQRAGAKTTDGYALVRAQRMEPHTSGVVAFSPSQRTKSFATADAEGEVWVRHATSEQTLLKLAPQTPDPNYEALVLAPRDNGVLAVGADGSAAFWNIDIPHPETTLGSIFGKVWYEGYPGPDYTWQSSSGTDTFEPKISLVPLIFGTVKAALYSLLFAVPVALLAAIYTSEFLHRRVRAVVKPVMEMMASLPSVVLGFLAALVVAPLVESWIAAVILVFVTLPFSLFLAAQLWQLLPSSIAIRFGGLPKFFSMFLVIGISFLMAYQLVGPFERLFFAGDFRDWVNGDIGGGTPFLALVLFPLSFLIANWILDRFAGQRIQATLRATPPVLGGVLDLARWAVTLIAGGIVSWALASLLGGAGFDLRGGVVDTYVQRNTLVVGFAMGFAVIPIIYTIAEDALNSVPEHLRAASLRLRGDPVADRDLDHPADGDERRLRGRHGRHGPRRGRNHDRRHGRGQHAGPRLEHLQRASRPVGDDRRRAARGGS